MLPQSTIPQGRVECICQNCGRTFTLQANIAKRIAAKFCSHACMNASRAIPSATCQTCGKTFTPAVRHQNKFCSKACYGKSGIPGYKGTLEERFWPKVDKNGPIIREELGPCWMWTGFLEKEGYGKIRDGKRMLKAHRVAFELANGPIAEGLDICHYCDNPPCVRSSHLFAATTKENIEDAINKGRMPWWKNAGVRHPGQKLTSEIAEQIRSRYQVGQVSQPELAREFGLSQMLISLVIRRKSSVDRDT